MIRQIFYLLGWELFPPGAFFTPDKRDVMLVSYPKSGNTWVRALVANVIRKEPSLAEMGRLVPDIYRCRARTLRRAHRFPCSGRLLKSHESFRPVYKRVIYIVRDPRDVCVSYYHYLGSVRAQISHATMSLRQFSEIFIAAQIDPYGSWGEHVGSWLCAESPELLLVRYEDLQANTLAELHRICPFLGLEVTDGVLKSAVSACSISRLRAREREERAPWGRRTRSRGDASFFRAGLSGNGRELDPPILQRMYDQWGDQMKTLGYV